MEGPSIYLAVEQLLPFVNKKILDVKGNTKIGKERLLNKKVLDIFSWGKHLVFQFDTFALRVHFMLFGSFQATIKDKKVTGDYQKKYREPRLQLFFSNGHIDFFSCSLRYIESSQAIAMYDATVDVMSPAWDAKKAKRQLQDYPILEIGDVLLDQNIFAGVGNIIKNEVLYLEKIAPDHLVGKLSNAKLNAIIKTVRIYAFQFYEWRKQFVLRKHYQIYRKGICPRCNGKVTRKKTGFRQRISFFCLSCQK